jgi:hypothetical protein
MENVTLEQLEAFDEWLTRIDEGTADQSDLDDWLNGQDNSDFIAAAYVAMFLGGEDA